MARETSKILWYFLLIVAFGAVLMFAVLSDAPGQNANANTLLPANSGNANTVVQETNTNAAVDPVTTTVNAASDSGNMTIATSSAVRTDDTWQVTITGKANVFESTVEYSFADPDGTLLESGHLTASGSMGELSGYTFQSEPISADISSVTVNVFSTSARDGSVHDLVTVEIPIP